MPKPNFLLCIDTETTGLDPFKHDLLDLSYAYVNPNSGEQLGEIRKIHFPLSTGWTLNADPKALEVNGYDTNYVPPTWSAFVNGGGLDELYAVLGPDVMLMGANIQFDIRFLAQFFRKYEDYLQRTDKWFPLVNTQPWYYKAFDIQTYYAGQAIFNPFFMPSLSQLCDLLGVDNTGAHDSSEDVRRTIECYQKM